MKEQEGRGQKAEPTFVDVLEHIGSGGVSVDCSEPKRAPRERIASYKNDYDRRRPARPDGPSRRDGKP